MMRNLGWALLAFILASCAALGSKTIYKSTSVIDFKNIGYSSLYFSDDLNKIFRNSDKIFYKSLEEEYYFNMKDSLQHIDVKFDFANLLREDIANVCQTNNLSGILVPSLKFIGVTQSAYFIPIGKYIDTEVELKLYSKNGELIVNTQHKTASGNSYMSYPTTNVTITDGGKGALRKLLKEYQLLK